MGKYQYVYKNTPFDKFHEMLNCDCGECSKVLDENIGPLPPLPITNQFTEPTLQWIKTKSNVPLIWAEKMYEIFQDVFHAWDISGCYHDIKLRIVIHCAKRCWNKNEKLRKQEKKKSPPLNKPAQHPFIAIDMHMEYQDLYIVENPVWKLISIERMIELVESNHYMRTKGGIGKYPHWNDPGIHIDLGINREGKRRW